MRWLWIVGPLVFLLVLTFVWANEDEEERRIKRALKRWVDEYLGALTHGDQIRNRRVKRLPPQFKFLVNEVGGGGRLADLVVVPKLAYLGARLANMTTSAHSFTIYCKLAKAAPTFACRPMPFIEGQQQVRRAEFPNDPDFNDTFIVEGLNKDAVKWLKPAVRKVLLDHPEVWLRVQGKSMALSLYGPVDAEALDLLLATADGIFSERGAGGAPSLFGEERDDAPVPATEGYRTDSGPRKATDDDEAATEEGQELEAADVGPRLAAFAIDAGLYALGIAAIAAVIGVFHSWHPMVLFNNPEPVVSQPWQGGWTTKGIGAFIAAETYLVGLLLYQAFLMTQRGQSLGKMLVGLRVVAANDKPFGFGRGVLLRSWLLALAPILTALALSRPLRARVFFAQLMTSGPLLAAGLALLALVAGIALARDGQAWFDRLARTRVVAAERWPLADILMGKSDGDDPLNASHLRNATRLLLFYIVANAVAAKVFGSWWA
jgi:uncharacterized RDD family membrane protein YckC